MNQEPTTRELLAAILDLGAATAQGFSRVDHRFDRVEARLTSVEGEVRGLQLWRTVVDGRLDRIDGRLDRIDGRLDRIDSRLDRMCPR